MEVKTNTISNKNYSWFLTGITFVLFTLLNGTPKCFSLFYMELLDTYDSSATAIGWILGLQSLIRMALGPVASILCKRFSIQRVIITGGLLSFIGYSTCALIPNIVWMYATFSVLVGVGYSLVYGPSIILLGYYFEHGRKGLAYAIAFSGSGFGIFVFPLLYSFLHPYFGFKGAMMLLGGLSLHIVPLGMFCVEPRTTIKTQDDLGSASMSEKGAIQEYDNNREKRWTSPINWSIFKNVHVFIVFIFTLIYSMATASHYAFSGALVQQKGLTERETGFLVSISGITDIIGNLALGLLFDLESVKRKSTTCYCSIHMLLTIIILMLPFLETFISFCIAFGLWGTFAAIAGTRNVLLSNNVRKDQFADAVGVILVALAIGSGAGPFITGLFVDSFRSYAFPFLIPGGMLAALSITVLILDAITNVFRKEKILDVKI